MNTRSRLALITVLAAMLFGPLLAYGKPCSETYPKGYEKKDPPVNGTMVTVEVFGDTRPCEVLPSPNPGIPVENVANINGLATDDEWVKFEGNFYHVKAEGLYRFIRINPPDLAPVRAVASVRNVIRVNDKQFTTIKSRLELLSGLSKLHVHGSADNKPTSKGDDQYLADLKKRAESSTLSTECGYIAALGIKLVDDNLGENKEARSISVLAAPKLHLEYDRGHELMEVRDPKTSKMILVDLDLGYVFYICENPVGEQATKDLDDLLRTCHLLSAQEFKEVVDRNKKPGFLSLSKTEIDTSYNDRPWLGWRLTTEPDKWGWYRQVFSGGQPMEGPFVYSEGSYSWKGPIGHGAYLGERFWAVGPRP
jgi:hypothetical protein